MRKEGDVPMKKSIVQPRLGLQGPTVSWLDPWAGEASSHIMRTGTGSVLPPQDPTPEPEAFIHAMQQLGAEFYVHHELPNSPSQSAMISDAVSHGLDIVLGNEYGNINGPYVEGTNRYDVPDTVVLEAARSGKLIGLLYDEPEHLQINADQYRKDGFYPHWGTTEGLSLAQAEGKVTDAVGARVSHVASLFEHNELNSARVPLISEHVFPVMFHTMARGGMVLCPKVMKESFQSLQLSSALGAAKQYNRQMWICADLWGPDTGPWFIRTPGLPGHSPEEYASALRLSYWMAPTHLFTENIDALLRYENSRFLKTEFGEVWDEFARKFVPEHPLEWSHSEANADIVFIHADDSNYGQNERLYGNRQLRAEDASQSVFHVWHLLSHGTIPAHGSCMHIPGYSFPRHELKANTAADQFPLKEGIPFDAEQRVHSLFDPMNNVLVFDETVTAQQLGQPKLIVVAGSRISAETLTAVRSQAESGATVIIASWLTPALWGSSGPVGSGNWLVTGNFLTDERVHETMLPFLGSKDCWMQRFGNTELRIYRGDSRGFTLDFEIFRK
jgi:hypothetical protein